MTYLTGEHAGGKWRLSYIDTVGGPGTLELDVNFILRVPLWLAGAVDISPYVSESHPRTPGIEMEGFEHSKGGPTPPALMAADASESIQVTMKRAAFSRR